MIRNWLRLNRHLIPLSIIFLGVALSTVIWTIKDRTPPPWDPADHISAGYDYYQSLAYLRLSEFARDFFSMPHFYAPLIHIVTALIFLVFGASELTGIGVNFVSLALILVYTYSIARRLYSERHASTESEKEAPAKEVNQAICWPAVLAALLVVCYHFPAWLVHDAFLDYPLIAIVAISFDLLIRADDFKVRRYSVAFGVAAGLGMLTKQTFPFFFILAGLFVPVRVLIKRDSKAIVNLIIAAGVATAIAAIWYVPHFEDVLAIYRVNQIGAVNENEAPLLTLGSNLFYIHALLSHQIQVPFGALFLWGLICSLVRRRRESILLYLWILSGVVSFAFVHNKDARYTVPVLPAVAVISVCMLAPSKKRAAEGRRSRVKSTLKPALGAAIVAWAVVSFINSQYPRDGYGLSYDLPLFSWRIFARNYYGFDHRPLSDDWAVTEIIRSVFEIHARQKAQPNGHNSLSNRQGNERHPTPEETVSPPASGIGIFEDAGQPILGVVVNLPQLNPSTIGMCARLMAPGRAGPPLIYVDWLVVESALDRLETCDYMLVREGYDAEEYVAPAERRVEQLVRANPGRFTKVASFAIPRNQEAIIYKIEKGIKPEQ